MKRFYDISSSSISRLTTHYKDQNHLLTPFPGGQSNNFRSVVKLSNVPYGTMPFLACAISTWKSKSVSLVMTLSSTHVLFNHIRSTLYGTNLGRELRGLTPSNSCGSSNLQNASVQCSSNSFHEVGSGLTRGTLETKLFGLNRKLHVTITKWTQNNVSVNKFMSIFLQSCHCVRLKYKYRKHCM